MSTINNSTINNSGNMIVGDNNNIINNIIEINLNGLFIYDQSENNKKKIYMILMKSYAKY